MCIMSKDNLKEIKFEDLQNKIKIENGIVRLGNNKKYLGVTLDNELNLDQNTLKMLEKS